MKFNLKKPCKNCPFRKDSTKGWLGFQRSKEIVDDVLDNDKTFSCHKTTGAETGEEIPREQHSFCAGALILLEKEKGYFASLPVRMAKMFGWFDESEMSQEDFDNVFDSRNDMCYHHK